MVIVVIPRAPAYRQSTDPLLIIILMSILSYPIVTVMARVVAMEDLKAPYSVLKRLLLQSYHTINIIVQPCQMHVLRKRICMNSFLSIDA